MWNYGMHMGGMWVWWLLILALIVGAAWVVGRAAAGGGGRNAPPAESPETILKQRYARGEIDREEYDRRLSDLRK